jgi:hypothetical protein
MQWFVHGKPAEVSATALDVLLTVKQEAMVVKKCSRGQTGVGRDSRCADGVQRRLDTMEESAADTATSKGGMGKEKVQVAIQGVRGETCESTVCLGDDGVKPR